MTTAFQKDAFQNDSFQTVIAPTAITQPASNITSSAARINGKISDDGGIQCTEY